MNLRVLSWNLFHGRDFPPLPEGDLTSPVSEAEPGVEAGGLRWKLLGEPVRGRRHIRLNRVLFREFVAFLAAAHWDVALLQEVPPRWTHRLAEATGALPRRSLTSRNWLRPLMSPVARLRPQLAGSWEGGSNLILVRGATPGMEEYRPGSAITGFRRSTLAWWPERRVVSMVELDCGLCVANFHASTGKRAAADVTQAASLATGWADGKPLLLGGDFNLRPRSSDLFDRIGEEFGLLGPTGPGSIDHLLVSGAEVLEPAEAWPPARRDVPDPNSGLKIRLSDHAPVSIRISV